MRSVNGDTAQDDKAGFAVRVSNAAGSVTCKPCVVSVGAAKAKKK